MTAFKLQVQDQSLHILENHHSPQTNDLIVQEILNQLQELTQAGLLAGGELLKINGKHTLPMAYVISHHLSHVYGGHCRVRSQTASLCRHDFPQP